MLLFSIIAHDSMASGHGFHMNTCSSQQPVCGMRIGRSVHVLLLASYLDHGGRDTSCYAQAGDYGTQYVRYHTHMGIDSGCNEWQELGFGKLLTKGTDRQQCFMQIVGVCLSVYLIDTAGRRPLLIWGGSISALAMVLLAVADYLVRPLLVVIAMCLFIAAFSMSYAGVFWVLVSEIFSMSTKSPAASAATAMLFLAGAVANLVFLTLHDWFGSASFLVFGGVAAAGAVYCYINVPETMVKTLAEIQIMLGGDVKAGDPTVASVEALPRAQLHDAVPRTSIEVQLQDQDQSRMESGLLSDIAERAAPLATQTGLRPIDEESVSLRDRLRLQWFNWSGYRQYQADPDAVDS